MLDLVNIDTNLLLCGGVHLPLQTNINIFSAVHQFIRGIYKIHLKFVYYNLSKNKIIICFAWHTVLLQGEGPVSC